MGETKEEGKKVIGESSPRGLVQVIVDAEVRNPPFRKQSSKWVWMVIVDVEQRSMTRLTLALTS